MTMAYDYILKYLRGSSFSYILLYVRHKMSIYSGIYRHIKTYGKEGKNEHNLG